MLTKFQSISRYLFHVIQRRLKITVVPLKAYSLIVTVFMTVLKLLIFLIFQIEAHDKYSYKFQ